MKENRPNVHEVADEMSQDESLEDDVLNFAFQPR